MIAVFLQRKAEAMWSFFFTFAFEIRKLSMKVEEKKKGKVLVIDDNEDIHFALNLLLKPLVEDIREGWGLLT